MNSVDNDGDGEVIKNIIDFIWWIFKNHVKNTWRWKTLSINYVKNYNL